MNKFIARLLPERLRPVKNLDPDQRTKLLAGVSEQDPCLRAITDRLAETLEGEFMVVIDPTRSDLDKLRACEGLRVAYWNLRFLEDERTAARAWVEQQQKLQQKP